MSVSHEQVAKAFVDNEKAKGSRMFTEKFDDKIIVYSYGYHFPIAINYWEKDYILFNSVNYSQSTQTHKNYVWQELPWNSSIIFVYGCDPNEGEAQIKTNSLKIEEYRNKLKRARNNDTKIDYEKDIEFLKEQNRLINLKFLNNKFDERILYNKKEGKIDELKKKIMED